MTGRTLFTGIFILVIIFAAGLFYSINYGHYTTAEYVDYEIAGQKVTNYREIDATTSPIKFRACFDMPTGTDFYAAEGNPTPLVAPFWFDCFDAKTLGEDLAVGKARAVVYDENKPFGVTSYLMIYPDGHGVAWRQLNECGDAKFSGDPLPPQCPNESEN